MSEKSQQIEPIVLKKRGRKPKNKCIEKNENEVPINSEEEPIIVHLPISMDDIVNDSNDNIFIKNEKELTINKNIKTKEINEDQLLKKLKETEKTFMFTKNINKINVHNIKFKPESKCLWCKNSFTTPSIELPEDYFNNTFFCIGNFCSWNCAKTYNIDANDSSTWKRESLLNLMYFKTYGEFKDINPAPSWLLLDEFGGHLNIEEFRNLFIFNNKDYLLLHPPLITRQLQIEESYKKSNNQNMASNTYDGELVLKRTKPLEQNGLNLEKTMGLKRNNKPFKKLETSI